jgi:hypothetical protein
MGLRDTFRSPPAPRQWLAGGSSHPGPNTAAADSESRPAFLGAVWRSQSESTDIATNDDIFARVCEIHSAKLTLCSMRMRHQIVPLANLTCRRMCTRNVDGDPQRRNAWRGGVSAPKAGKRAARSPTSTGAHPSSSGTGNHFPNAAIRMCEDFEGLWTFDGSSADTNFVLFGGAWVAKIFYPLAEHDDAPADKAAELLFAALASE